MAKIPRDKIIDLVNGREGDMKGVGHELAVKDAAFDIALGKDRDFLGEVETLEGFYKVETPGTIRLRYALELTLNKNGSVRTIFGQLVLPPADRKIASKRLAVVEVCTHYRGFKI